MYNKHTLQVVDPSDVKDAAKLFSVPDFVGDACKAIVSRVRGAMVYTRFICVCKQAYGCLYVCMHVFLYSSLLYVCLCLLLCFIQYVYLSVYYVTVSVCVYVCLCLCIYVSICNIIKPGARRPAASERLVS